MPNTTTDRTAGLPVAAITALCFFALCASAVAIAEPSSTTASDAGPRQSTTKQFSTGGRSSSSPTAITEDRFDELVTDGQRRKPGTGETNSKLSTKNAESVSNDFWIYHADVVLFADDDNDGYSYGIDLLFDADTLYEVADVYAVLYLSLEGGPWNEYAVTDDFRIFGATSDDEYVVVTELDSGYPTGSYDLLIELYDAQDGTFLTSLGPADTSALGFLRLEDFNRDDPGPPPVHSHGGGGTSPALLAMLLLCAIAIRYRHSPQAPPLLTE